MVPFSIRSTARQALSVDRWDLYCVQRVQRVPASKTEPFDIKQTIAVAEAPLPPPLLVAESNDSKKPSPVHADDGAKSPKPATQPGTGTSKPTAKKARSGNKPEARPAMSGARLGSLGSGGYAQTSVFGVQGKGNKFVYVFDRSASMEGPPLAAAKMQLLQSLQSLDSVHQFHILFFNTGIQAFDISGGGHRIAFATDRNKRLAANFVGGVTADGGTDRMLALREAINFAPDVIFFLTDADDPMSSAELAEIARANQKAQAAICVIEFGRRPTPKPNDFLARLARESGGQYGYVDTTTLPAEQTVRSTNPGAK